MAAVLAYALVVDIIHDIEDLRACRRADRRVGTQLLLDDADFAARHRSRHSGCGPWPGGMPRLYRS